MAYSSWASLDRFTVETIDLPVKRRVKILPWQASYLERVWRLRQSIRNKVVARRLGMNEKSVRYYTSNLHRLNRKQS